MLNISPNTINQIVLQEQFRSYEKTALSSANRMFTRWLMAALILFCVTLFLPWTQNIQSDGMVTTLKPEHRPQTIHSTIAGRVERWYVQEGALVKKGDTILHLSEIKAEYFDPELVPRTDRQVAAKSSAIGAYSDKARALAEQIEALRIELDYKERQLVNKIEQNRLKIISDSIETERARIDFAIAQSQYARAEELFKEGIRSLVDLEQRRLREQETAAKLVAVENKLATSRNELDNLRLELAGIRYEYGQKVAKAESDRFSTLSERFEAEASVNKLQIEAANYRMRSGFYYITAPQDCYINQAITPGIGETIKEGDPIVSITPVDFQLAVELFVKPMDLPLVRLGEETRFIFDGWPAFIFSGWPDQSFGTYRGHVAAIDNVADSKGLYRILIAPDESEKPWPRELRPGSGAKGILLLNRVRVWYEIWRQLNGFPPDFYDEQRKLEAPKLKAPARSIK
jgi:adhesin transport system membrane fusion protein